ISKRAQRIVISPIKEMSLLADSLQEKTGADIISFGQGIPYFDTPKYIKDGIRKSLNEISTAKYTLEPGITELRELIAKDLKKRKGVKSIRPKKEIMVTVGCQEAVACSLTSVIDEGDEVLLFSPCYASHIQQVLQFGGIPKFVFLKEKNGWSIDFEALKNSVSKKTKAILFSNPSNPTGSVLTMEETVKLVEFAIKNDLIIIADETYDFLVYDGIKHISLASFEKAKDRIILCGGFSKRFAMTGYRVGFAYADAGIIDHMLKVHDALAICAPAISQKAAIFALKEVKKSIVSVSEFVGRLSRNRELMCKELDRLKNVFEYQKPKGAYYIFVKYKKPKINSFELALKILKEAKVITIPGAAFGPSGEGYLRFSFACSSREIEEGFKRLEKWSKKQSMK
ncbi:MAG: pyridoxal phosphate-dependent aminotransferase, partial [bacterium]|nr:pyridoxal phosphate-dependent aminotransferase [bacterium]